MDNDGEEKISHHMYHIPCGFKKKKEVYLRSQEHHHLETTYFLKNGCVMMEQMNKNMFTYPQAKGFLSDTFFMSCLLYTVCSNKNT